MPPIQANHLFVRLIDNNTANQKAQSVLDVVSSHGKDAASFVKNLSLTLAGTGIIGISGVGKSVAPDNTFFDKFSLVGIIIGAITTIWGGVGLYRGNKQIKQAEIPPTPFTIGETTASNISDIVKEINSNFNDRFKISKDIVNGSRATGHRSYCYSLIEQWIDPTSGFINILNSNNSRSELLFENGFGTGVNITSSELKERMAVLIGYTVGSRANAALDTESRNLIENMLCLDQIENPNTWGRCELEHMLPDEFTLLYTAARHYKLNHMDSDTSIANDSMTLRNAGGGGTSNIVQADTITNISSPTESRTKDDAKTDVGRIANSRNYLRTLQKGIEFVLQVEREKSSGQNPNETRQRDADVLRSALVTGLGLQVNDLNDTVTKLDRILKGHASNTVGSAMGTERGLNEKLNTLEQFWGQIDNTIRNNSNTGLTLNAVNLRFPLYNQAGLISVT